MILKKKNIVLFIASLFAILLVSFGCTLPGSNLLDDGNTSVLFNSAVQTSGTSGTADSTGLILTFNIDPTTLTADNITITGATKGALSDSGTTRSLAISGITVADGATVTVSIASPTGYNISSTVKTAIVYRALSIGMVYQGGKIAYIFQSGTPDDPGYVIGETHGLITATINQSDSVPWALEAYKSISVSGGTETELGTGSSNTDKIIAQNGSGTAYAAGIARAYNGGGYLDWYLPSGDELAKVHDSKHLIGGFPFTLGYFWTSSENSNDSALRLWFNGNPDSRGEQKSSLRYVRAVRSF